MTNNKVTNKSISKTHIEQALVDSRQAYQKPELVFYGDVRDVTLGPTGGVGESGCEFDRRMGDPISCP